ncbi:translocation/assembly module TamB domain-containing protein [Chryseobacterium sp. NKUCC03_KSP]|uniref:translocation/assembly module TamB domain-containing protein n=1 Tax=Chryseobacterium sp. NKUCC03_KSP TaxID=2842125 RepID=UPI001C5A5D89|nr:translocation/assembly module TamB [Chryseobacterium sp. NKUCC03_KSP]MBW3523098.1 translocation/assembly module TamB [Chryseobacterium sp. NKUCC03_KSP]
MAKLENNNENENKKSVAENLGDQVQKTVENVQETVKEASELASDAINHPIDTAQEFGKQAAKDVVSYSWWAKLLLFLFWTLFSIIVLVLIAINLPVTKRWAADQALQIVNRDFKAKMSTESVEVDFFGDVTIKGLKIKDHKNLDFIKVREFKANSDWFSLATNIGKNNSLSFNGLKLNDADIKVITYKGDSISNFIRFTQLFDSGKKRDPKKPPFQLNARLEILNSKVSIVNQNSPGEPGKWLTATNVNLIAPKVKVKGVNIDARIDNFTFITKRWGKSHFVETFSTDFSMTEDFLSLGDLTLNTDHSLLQGDIKFNLNKGSWADFTNKVKWDMNMKLGSQISGYDISYFVTNWDNFIPFNASGKMTGPLNHFTLENFLIRNPSVNIATKKLKADHLLKDDFTIETEDLSADFTYKDLKAMMPTFVSSKMKNFADDFGKLKYNGTAKVTPKQVYVSSGNLMTGIGQAKISNFSLADYSSTLPKYKGYAEVNDLNTSVITKSKAVGLISGKFNLDGQSFDVNTMRLSTRSQISSIEIMNKEINNVVLDGLLDHKKYNGLITVNDEQAKATVKGLIDFSTSRISANVDADVTYLNMNYFTNKAGSQIVSGRVNGKMAMSTINDLNLDVEAFNVNFATADQKYHIPNAKLKTFVEGGERSILIDAPGAVNGKISGKYDLADLAGMVENGLGKILVGPEPRKLYRGQTFAMNFDVEQGVVAYFMPDLKLPQGAKVEGEYDGNSNNLILNLDAASLKYIMTKKEEITEADRALAEANPDYKIDDRIVVTRDSAMVDSVMVRINTANTEQQLYAKIKRLEYNKNILKDVILTGKNDNNSVLRIATSFKHGSPEDELNESLKDYAINFNQSTNPEGDYVFRFEPTEVNLNNVKWSVDTNPELDHYISYRRKTSDFEIHNLKIYSDESSLLINESIFRSAKDFYVDAEVQNFAIEKILEMQSGGNPMDIKGLANGNVKIKMDKSTLQPLVYLTVDNIMMNGNDMGDVTISAVNGFSLNVYDVDVKVASAGVIGNNNLHLTGTVNNNTPSPTIDLTTELRDFDLAFTQQFVQTIFGNLRGKATGDLKINGTLKDLDYSGDIALKEFGLKLLFTGVDYSFDDTVIPLSKGLAILNNIGVHDGRSNSKGTISGAIQFETLSSMGVNLVMRADNLLMLNTTQKDYDLFWGRVYGQGDLYVDGPVSGLNITTPNMKALNGSTFTFNSSSTSNVEEFKMLRFLKEGKDGLVTLEEKKKTGANMNIDFSLDVDKGTTVNVLVGDDVGNITVKGMANNLRFQMNRQGNIAMNGSYMVDNGTFVSKAILNRTFQIQKNSSIRWDGDAMKPALDITASYVRMVSNAGTYLNMGQLPPVKILLQMKITNTLTDPKLTPNVVALDVSSQVEQTLATKINQTEGENVLQFGSILVLNNFNVADAGGVEIDAIGVAESTGYNMFLKQLGSVFNNLSSQFQVDLNYVKSDPGSNNADRANAGVSIDLSPRITVKTGLGIPLSKTESTSNNYLSGEGSVEYDISKKNDGTLVLRGYSKPTNIGMGVGTVGTNGSANQAYGGGIVWSKSFNSLFKKKKKDKKKTPSETAIKTDSVKSSAKKP